MISPQADAAPATRARRAATDPTGWLLVPIVAVAALLRFRLALATPLWFEEIYVLLVARQPAARVLWTANHDIHPPLPFLLRHALTAAGGGTALAQKTLSIALFLLALVLAWRLARRLFGGAAAAIAAGLTAVSVALVRYGQEANMFSLQWLLALAVVDAWTRWTDTGRRRDAALAVAAAVVALYTHYVFLAVEAIVFVWGFAALRRTPRRLGAWAGLHALAAAAFLPQLPVFLAQLAREGTLRFASFPAPAALAEGANFLGMHHRLLEGALPLAALAALLDPKRPRAASLLGLLVLVTPLASRVLPVTFPTEFLFELPLFYVLVGAGLARIPWRALRAALPAAVILWGAVFAWRDPVFREPVAQRATLDTLRALRAPGDLVLHAETHSLLFSLWYDPAARNRILVEDSGTQYFDGGLVIPDSAGMTRAAFAAARARGEAWWAVGVSRARVARNVVQRAGAAEMATFDSLAAGPRRVTPPVILWQGRR